jgi:hypothetical protein
MSDPRARRAVSAARGLCAGRAPPSCLLEQMALDAQIDAQIMYLLTATSPVKSALKRWRAAVWGLDSEDVHTNGIGDSGTYLIAQGRWDAEPFLK